jgi:GT2 family glycosyltransferase
VSIVVVSFEARSVLERCLSALTDGGHEVIVVDNASGDGSPDLVRERFPDVRLIEASANIGFGAANNLGIRAATHPLVLLCNSDAWPVGDAIDRLVAVARERPRAAGIGPRLSDEDRSLQRSVRGFPTVWRLATEYLFLRKLAPGSRALNAFYGAGFDHRSEREAEFLTGAVLLCRRDVLLEVGGFDERFFMFSEEVDLCYRLRRAGWSVLFTPAAEFVHLGGASTRPRWGSMFREQLRGHLLFLDKHHGARTAARARTLLLAALRLRGLLFPGARGRTYRQAAAWLASAPADRLIADDPRRPA